MKEKVYERPFCVMCAGDGVKRRPRCIIQNRVGRERKREKTGGNSSSMRLPLNYPRLLHKFNQLCPHRKAEDSILSYNKIYLSMLLHPFV
jgi:hypothetical protein